LKVPKPSLAVHECGSCGGLAKPLKQDSDDQRAERKGLSPLRLSSAS
jgi:hypothetical protein